MEVIQATSNFKENQKPIRTCGKCARLFLHAGTNKRDNCEDCHKRYAALMPKSMVNRFGEAGGRPSKQLEITCRHCRSQAVIWGGSRTAGLYCSRKCAAQAKTAKRLEASRSIDSVAKTMQISSANAVSAGVLKWVRQWTRIEVRSKRVGKQCENCDAPIHVDNNGARSIRLCGPCKASKGMLTTAQRKVKRITRRSIWAEENWTCYLCGRICCQPPKHGGWIPGMATVDHVVPQSKGGGNNRSNLRTCCAECNSIKADDPVEAMGRVGQKPTPAPP